MQALTRHTRFARNVTQDLLDQTAQALSTIVQATAIDREQVTNIIISAATMQQ